LLFIASTKGFEGSRVRGLKLPSFNVISRRLDPLNPGIFPIMKYLPSRYN
jgi:hypothetical protein